LKAGGRSALPPTAAAATPLPAQHCLALRRRRWVGCDRVVNLGELGIRIFMNQQWLQYFVF
jgi:hypothetical protein